MSEQQLLDISVLYVEDELAAREASVAILRRRVREVLVAKDGREGLALFGQYRPDLIVTDIRMPIMDGLEMLRTIRAISSEVLVIVTSAHSDTHFLLDAIDLGVDQYVLKPVKVEKLIGAVAKCAGIVLARRAEKLRLEIKTQLRKLSRAVEQSPASVIITDTAGNIEYVNPKFSQLTGYAAAEVIGSNPRMLQSGQTTAAEYERLWGDLRSGKEWHGEFCNRKKNGELYWESATIAPVTDESGVISHYVAIKEDITARVRAQELSRKYSRDLEQLVAIAHEVTITADLKELYRTFVTAARDLLGLDFSTLMLLSEDGLGLTIMDTLGFPDELIGAFSVGEGQGVVSLVLQNQRAEFVEDFARENRFEVPEVVKRRGIRSALAVPMLMKGETIGVLVGHTLGLRQFSSEEIMIYQHIANLAAVAIRNAMNTERLRKSEKYTRDVTAALGEGVYVLNAKGEVTFMNPEAEVLFGWPEAELLGKNLHDLTHNRRGDGTYLPFAECRMRQVIETGNRFHSTEEVFVRSDGTVFPVSIISSPLLEGGRIVASVTAFRDISERKRIEQEREQLIADLQKAMAEIKTLHGIIPICASCKKIRDEEGAWHQLESYISAHSDTKFSHGICKECARKLYPELYLEE